MSQEVERLLAQLDSELADRSFEAARETITALREQYDSQRASERRLASRSTAVAADSSVTADNAATLGGLAITDGSTRMGRVALLTMARAVIETHAELASSGELDSKIERIRSALEDVRAAEVKLSDQASEAEAVVEQSEVPPTTEVVETKLEPATVPVDGSATLIVTVENTGDEAASGVTVGPKTSTESMTIERRSIGELSAGSTGETALQVTESQTGRYTVTVHATPEEGNSGSITRSISVASEETTTTDTPPKTPSTDTSSKTPSTDTDQPSSETDDESLPLVPVGIGTAAAGFGGLAAWRRFGGSDDETEMPTDVTRSGAQAYGNTSGSARSADAPIDDQSTGDGYGQTEHHHDSPTQNFCQFHEITYTGQTCPECATDESSPETVLTTDAESTSESSTETELCLYCGESIPKRAQVCPHCGEEPWGQ